MNLLDLLLKVQIKGYSQVYTEIVSRCLDYLTIKFMKSGLCNYIDWISYWFDVKEWHREQ